MKKNLKYLIIGGTAVASVIIVAAPIAATSKYTYPSDPLKVVSDDLNQITNAAFTQGTFDYKTKYADLKSEVLSKKQADGSWNVDGFIDFFKGQQNSYDKVSFADAKIKVADIKPIDDKQSFDVYFYVQSTKANDRGDFVKSSVAKATISFGYKPEFNLAAFAHDVTRASFTGTGTVASGQNPNVTNSLKAYTLADVTATTSADRAILELTPVQDFETDVNSATSSDDAIAKLGKYFDISSVLSKINSNSENVITAATTTPATSQTGVKATQDATTTTSEQRYKVSLIKDPNNNTKYITLVNGGKSAKIFLQTEFSDAFKKQYEGLPGIDAKHIDILEIPLTGFADSSTLASQFAAAPTLQESDYYATPATGAAGGAGGTATKASTSTASTSETVKIDLKKQDPLDWIFAYNSFFFPSKAYKDAYAKLYIESSLNKPLSISDFALTGENDTNKTIIDNKIGELKSTVRFDGDSLGLENQGGKVVATIAGTISVSSAQSTPLFTKNFTLTLDNFKDAGSSRLNTLFNQENSTENPITISEEQQKGQTGATQKTVSLIFQKDKKFGTGATLDYNAISAALKSQNPDAAKNVLADPTTTDVRFYTGERLEALTSKFTLPTDAQIASDFSLDTSELNKKNGIFNIKSSFLPTDLSVSRYYFALANEGLDKAAPQFLKMLEAAGLVAKSAKIDTTKPIFEQLKDIHITNVNGGTARTQGGTDNPMRFFVINNENQEQGTLLHQSVLVNWSQISGTTTPYSKIQNTENSDYDVLKSIIDLNQADIFTNRIDKISELPSFVNAAELLIAMYTKVRLLSAPGVGFPLLPIGKNAQLSYGIGIKGDGQSNGTLTNSKSNNFKYQYTLKLVGDNNSEKQLYLSSENDSVIGAVEVKGTEVKSEVQSLNQIVANIPSIYNNVWVDAGELAKLKATGTSNTTSTTISNDTLSSIGLQGLSDYLTSVAPGFTISGDTTKAIVDPEGLRSYKTLNLILGKGTDQATTPIRIFVYEKKQSKNTDVQAADEKNITNTTSASK